MKIEKRDMTESWELGVKTDSSLDFTINTW